MVKASTVAADAMKALQEAKVDREETQAYSLVKVKDDRSNSTDTDCYAGALPSALVEAAKLAKDTDNLPAFLEQHWVTNLELVENTMTTARFKLSYTDPDDGNGCTIKNMAGFKAFLVSISKWGKGPMLTIKDRP